MARKSRKELIRAQNAGLPVPDSAPEICALDDEMWDTVGYTRLSVFETRDRKDSLTLQTQKAYLRQFIEEQPDLRLVSIYEDNGETGTNFSRAGFEAMMNEVRSGRANCIVVKDLSRFGRDYIETGNYLEHIFPFMGVRFISLGDGYDSADATTADCLTVALKNLMNQMYSKDISRKSGSVLREKIRRGEFIGAYASYGYIKDPADKHHLIIDPEAAAVVRAIFQKKLSGTADTAITRWLNESDIPSPCCYRYQKGILLDRRFAEKKPWKVQVVKQILRSPVYLGHMVQGRRRSEFYAGKSDRLLPPEEWTVVEHTHAAIVSQEEFDAVQAICAERNAKYHANLGKYDHLGKSKNILKSLVFCGDCGRPLVRYKQVSHGKYVTYNYMCPNYAAQLERSGCSYKFLPESILLDTLAQLIRKETEQAVDMTALARRFSEGQKQQASACAMEIKRLNQALLQVETKKKDAMRDFLAGELSREEHEQLNAIFAAESDRLKERITVLRAEQHRQTETLTEKNPWLLAFGCLDFPENLTSELSHKLIDRITVYENDRFEVLFRFQDEREQLLAATKEGVV